MTFRAATPSPADADARNWVDRFAPSAWKPYLRLARVDRPIGIWLLLIPCWLGQGLAFADGANAPWLAHAFLFTLGAVVMRGAGCAYNDIVDRDIDAKVQRTAMRPIPAGQISLKEAWMFLVVLALIGLGVLLQFNPFTIYIGLGSLILVAAYPFMKRITWWPQVWLGLTFNWGVLVGYASATGYLSASAVMIYAACVLWTIGYDTIYAHQDKEDDALIGVKSSARALGENTSVAIVILYGGVLLLFIVAGVTSEFSAVYFLALAAPSIHFIWQYAKLDVHNSEECLKIFKSNRSTGLLLLAPLLLERALQYA